MEAVLAEPDVAKRDEKKTQSAERPDASVRIYRDVLQLAKLAADYTGKTLIDYVSDVVRPAAERDIDTGYARLRTTPKRRTKPGEAP